MTKRQKRKILPRETSVCCVACGRVFLGQFHLQMHKDQLAKPLWYRALYKRWVATRVLAAESGVVLAAFLPWERKQG